MTQMAAPQNIRAHRSDLELELVWPDRAPVRISFRQLRGLCPCANCVNELTGERKFFADDARPDVSPAEMELTGNYALRITWNDGHRTGIFTWDYLRRLSDQFTSDRISDQVSE